MIDILVSVDASLGEQNIHISITDQVELTDRIELKNSAGEVIDVYPGIDPRHALIDAAVKGMHTILNQTITSSSMLDESKEGTPE